MTTNRKLYCHTLSCKMAHAVKSVLRVLQDRFKEADICLTLEQYFLLNILENEEGLILKDLADIVDKDKSAVFRHIEVLEENYFVVRATDPDDKRRKVLLITKPGLEVLEEARKLDIQLDNEITNRISDNKLKDIEKYISEILEHANELNCR